MAARCLPAGVDIQTPDASTIVLSFTKFSGSITLRNNGAEFSIPLATALTATAATPTEDGGGRPGGSSTSPPGHPRTTAKPLERPTSHRQKAQKRAHENDDGCGSGIDQSVSQTSAETPVVPSAVPLSQSSLVVSEGTPLLSFAQAEESCGDNTTPTMGIVSKGGSPARDAAVVPATPLLPAAAQSKKRKAGRGAPTSAAAAAPASVAVAVADAEVHAPAAGAGAAAASLTDAALQGTTTKVAVAAVSQGLKKLDTRGAAPEPRWGHSAFLIEGTNKMVVYGGASKDAGSVGDCTVLNLNTMTWSSPMNCESLPRVWHSGTVLPGKHAVLFFGGERDVGMETPESMSDMMIFDTDLLLWYPPATSGHMPSARSGHTITAVGENAVLFGGVRNNRWLSDVYILRLDNFRWKAVSPLSKGPSARSYHSATVVGSKVVFFGGNDQAKCYNDVYVLEFNGEAWSWSCPVVMGQKPCPRTGHAATLIGPSSILIHGGWDPQDDDDAVPFKDAFILDTNTWEWSPAVMPDAAAWNRTGHSICVANVGDLGLGAVLFGGVNIEGDKMNELGFLPLALPPSL